MKNFELNYSNDKKEINIPDNTTSISFYISPDYIIPHTPNGSFYGLVAFDSMIDYTIDNGVNCIEIEIPAINNSFFQTYYIKGDYARIKNDSIIWKGQVYKKLE